MKNFKILSCGLLRILLLISMISTDVSLAYAQPKSKSKPNIIFILLDDVGWKDFGCYGSTFYETPHIDELAKDGIRFTNSYAYPQCSPTRLALLTGQNPARVGLTRAIIPADYQQQGPHENMSHPRGDWYMADPAVLSKLPSEMYTIPELLKGGGYKTAMFGKWHLGLMKDNPPTNHGFDVYYGGAESGPRSYFSPYKLEYLSDGPRGEHIDDRLTDEAIAYLERSRAKRDRQPVFLYLSYFSSHEPWVAKEELVKKYKAKVNLSDRQNNPVYAAMMQTVDDNIGRLKTYLRDKGMLENTIIVISGDNGGLERVNGFGRDNRGAFPIGTTITSNEPLRGGKSMIYEGGLRVPTIVYWPNLKNKGITDDTPIAVWDWLPTFLSVSGVSAPQTLQMDGTDLTGLIFSRMALNPRSFYWHFPHYQIADSPNKDQPNFINKPCSAIRQGKWKFIYYYESAPELYDLEADPREINNIATKHPEKVKMLSADILEWIRSTNAYLPLRNVNYKMLN